MAYGRGQGHHDFLGVDVGPARLPNASLAPEAIRNCGGDCWRRSVSSTGFDPEGCPHTAVRNKEIENSKGIEQIREEA